MALEVPRVLASRMGQNAHAIGMRARVTRSDRETVVGGAVVDDDELDVWIRLAERALDRLRQPSAVVVRGNRDSDEGISHSRRGRVRQRVRSVSR